MILLTLAWRNILRNLRRSLITVIAISLGLAGLIFIWGFIDGINEQMIDNSTGYLSGHLRVHQQGYHQNPAPYRSMPDNAAIQQELSGMPSVVAVAPRVEDTALLSGAEKSRGVRVIGVDPTLEPRVTTIARAVVKGRYLKPGDDNAILLGDSLAAAMQLSLGDEVVLITQAVDGSIGAGKYRLTGIFDSGIDVLDGNHAFLPLVAAQELYSLQGQLTSWVIRLEKRQQADAIATRIAARLNAGGDTAYEVIGWRRLLPSVVQMVEFHEAVTYIVLWIVFFVVGIGVANTILMAVMERTREFGVLMALGTSARRILGMVLLEALLLGTVGLIVGNIIGVGLIVYFSENGINFGQFTQAMEIMPGLSSLVFPLLRWDHLLMTDSIVFLVSLVPALLPAWRASRLEPALAIKGMGRFVRHRLPTAHRVLRRESRWPMFMAMAMRSAWRNPRRSLLTASATAFGLAAFLFLYAFADGFFEQMIRNSTGFVTGHLQIEQQGFRDELSPGLHIANPQPLLQDLRGRPMVKAAAPRVQVKAMASSPTRTRPIVLYGVVPAQEARVTTLAKSLLRGEYLEEGDGQAMLIGQKLQQKLDVSVGEKLVITTQQAGGSLASAAYRVSGVFKTGSEFFDDGLAFVTLSAAQSLLGMGDAVSTITVSLQDRRQSGAMVEELQKRLSGTGYEALSWEQLLPVVVQMIDLTKMDFYVVLAIVFLVVALGVMNTLLMSVLERTREFGVLMALGTQPAQILRLVLYEALVLGLLGMAAGFVIGLAMVAYYSGRGMDLSAYAQSLDAIPGMTATVQPELMLEHVWLPALILFATGLLASLYPAWRAARLDPVVALHHV